MCCLTWLRFLLNLCLTHHVLVDVVGDDCHVVLLAQVGHHLDLLTRVHLAQRVVGVVEHDGLGLLIKEGGQLGGVKLPVLARRLAARLKGKTSNACLLLINLSSFLTGLRAMNLGVPPARRTIGS